MLPECLGNFVWDVAERIGCPPEFPAVTALAVLSGLISNHYRIYPKQYDNWAVSPNLWGVLVGGPGSGKSTGMGAVRPIGRSVIQKGPYERRRWVDDVTYQALLDVAQTMDRGTVVMAVDEVASVFAGLGQQGQEKARECFLTAFDGNSDYELIRRGSGSTTVRDLRCVIVGGIQPEKLQKHLQKMTDRAGDDGFL